MKFEIIEATAPVSKKLTARDLRKGEIGLSSFDSPIVRTEIGLVNLLSLNRCEEHASLVRILPFGSKLILTSEEE